VVTLSAMSVIGRSVLNPVFYYVAKSKSQEAFLSIIVCTVLIMSYITKGIGLSDTLGAFLAGITYVCVYAIICYSVVYDSIISFNRIQGVMKLFMSRDRV
jgi:hypothetical protein